MTLNELTELVESDGARLMLERGEERGWIDIAELEAFTLEHELGDAAACGSITNLTTVTSGTRFPPGSPLVVPILSGTGIFNGVTGTILIAPGNRAVSVYRLTLPS